MEGLAKILERHRLKQGLSQKQVAMVLNLPEADYAGFESGRSEISAVQLMRLCEYYGVSLDVFVSSGIDTGRAKTDAIGAVSPEVVRPLKPATKVLQKKANVKKLAKKSRSGFAAKGTGGTGTAEFPEGSEEQRFISLIANIVVENAMREAGDRARLKESPGGFHYESKKACVICGDVVEGEDSWYDRNGLKCMHCQRAIDGGIIPYWICKSKDSFYTEIQLELRFAMTAKIRKAFVKSGLLKSRVIPKADGKGKHVELFLRSDNRDFLPPHKKLRVGGPVKEINKDGREEYVMGYPWYYFVDPLEHLKDYGISSYLRFEPQEAGANESDESKEDDN